MKEEARKCFKCKASPSENSSTILHRFPKPGRTNSHRCEMWAMFCFPQGPWHSPEFQTKLYSEHRMLCSKHFNKKYFIDAVGKKMVKSSVPDDECDKTNPTIKTLETPHTCTSSEKTNIEQRDVETTPIGKSNYLNIETETQCEGNIKKLVAELSRDFDVTVDKEESASLIKEDSIHLSSEEEETPFSWQKTTCIPYDTDEVGASENDIHLYDSSPQEFEAAQLKHTERPSSGVLEELKCNLCERTITGPFRYSCVQCYDFDLCGACEARGAHHMHYVLRAPGHKTISEVQSLIRAIRQALTAAEPIAPISVDSDELKTEIKEEAGERLVPVNDDDDPLSLNVKPEETTDDESTDSYSTLSVNEEEPFPKRPALSPKNVSHSTPSISEEPSPKRHAFSTKNVSHSTPTISEKPCPKRPALSPKNVSHSTPSISEEPSPKRRALSPKNVSHKTKQTITPSASTSKITQGVAACINNPPVLQLKPIDNLRINVPISAKPPIITLHQRMNNFSSKGRPLILRQIKTYPGKKQYSPLIGSHVNVSGKPPHLGERPVVSQPGTVGSQMLGNIFKK